MREPLLGMTPEELHAALGRDVPLYRARQLYEAIYRQRVREIDEIRVLPAELRLRLAENYLVGWPEEAARFDSTDGTRRYLLRLRDGKTVEAVFMPEQTRDTLCISSQVGCAVDCQFCLTARMGWERNLTAGEILAQVLHLAHDNRLWSRERRINIVLMGQGEPLLNFPALERSCRILADPRGLGISPRRITVSTAGIIPRIDQLGALPDAWRPKLAISLNASSAEQRSRLMPITRKYPLRALLDACRRYPLRSWERLTFEYVLLKGVNDSTADARCLVRLLEGLRAKVNLIPLNPGPGIMFETPEAECVQAFQSIVRKAVPCFVRKPRGRDVYAACGQLKRMSIASDRPGGRQLVQPRRDEGVQILEVLRSVKDSG